MNLKVNISYKLWEKNNQIYLKRLQYFLYMTNLNYLLIYVIGLNKTLNLPLTLFYNFSYWNKYQKYKTIYNRTYNSEKEEHRYKIFRDNFKKISKVSPNKYAKYMDLTPSEFKNETDSCCLFNPKFAYYRTEYSCNYFESKEYNLPDSVDWRDKGVVTPVKNQGKCGSCWTFSATGAMEGAWALKSGSLISLSEQQLIDCVTQDQGCNGGEMNDAFEYAIQYPICSDKQDPYEAKDDICERCNSNIQFTSCKNIPPNNQLALKEAVALHGPVSVSIQADKSYFQLYTDGIITDNRCGTNLDHGVLIVGYGEDPKTYQKYWLVKNSWGQDWGENGYVRIARSESTNDPGICGIAMQASFPIV